MGEGVENIENKCIYSGEEKIMNVVEWRVCLCSCTILSHIAMHTHTPLHNISQRVIMVEEEEEKVAVYSLSHKSVNYTRA